MPSVRKLSRRKIAMLIRVRQELHKRIDAVLPAEQGNEPVVDLFDREFAGEARRATGGRGVCELLRTRAVARFPLTHLATRAADSLPDRDDLRASAASILRGEWELFGQPLTIDLATLDWTRHPTTGARADDAHWTRVAYMGGIGGGDVKQIWELSRHAELVRLAQAYHLTRDNEVADAALVLLDRWIAQNPPGRGVNWTSSLEVAFRAIAWCWIWTLTAQSPCWNDDRLGRFLASLSHHARHIARFDSVHHSPNTHLTGEALGLLYVGLLFPELARGREWADLARTILDEELDHQVLPDGMHFERATGYHRYTLEFYAHYLLLANAFGLPAAPRLRERVRDQAAASWLFERPDGTWPVIGDEDSGNTLRLSTRPTQDQRPILAVAAALCDDAALAPNEPGACGAAWWLLDDPTWARLGALRGEAQRSPASGALASAGYYVGRDTHDRSAWFCVVDAGPHGGERTGHAHTDLGHVEIAHGSSHLVVDPGCAAYTTDPVARDLARSERVHACLVVDRDPLAVPAGPFSWTRVAPTPTVSWSQHDDLWCCELQYARPRGAGSIDHRRQVVLVRNAGIVVCDWVTGDGTGDVSWHWPLGADPNDIALDENVLRVGQHHVTWLADGRGPGPRASLELLTRSVGYGRAKPGRLLRVAADRTTPITLVTTFTAAAATTRASFTEDGRVRITLGETTGSLDFTVAPGVAPSRTDVATPVRPRAEGAVR